MKKSLAKQIRRKAMECGIDISRDPDPLRLLDALCLKFGFSSARWEGETPTNHLARLCGIVGLMTPEMAKAAKKRGNPLSESVFEASRLKPWARPGARRAPSQAAINEFYASWEWKRLRYDTMQKLGFTCMCCRASRMSGEPLVVDHIKPVRWFWDLRLEPTNLQVLCESCNMGKGSRDQSDFRPEPVAPTQAELLAAKRGYESVQEREKARKAIVAFLGAYGCHTRYLKAEREMIRVARLVFGLEEEWTLPEIAAAIGAMSKTERRVASANNVFLHWPEPCWLWPADARIRQWKHYQGVERRFSA